MYNEKQKIRFIKETAKSISSADTLEYMFNRFEKFEELWGKDVCQASDEELQQLMNNTFGIKTSSASLYTKLLKRYILWCKNNDIHSRDAAIYLRQDYQSRVRSSFVANPVHLQYCLDLIFDGEDNRTIDNVYRSYFWIAFGGVDESKIKLVKRSDVDLYNMIVRFDNEEFPIYREGIKALRNTANLDSFMYTHPNYTKAIERQRFDNQTLLSGIKSIPSAETFRSQVSTIILKASKQKDNVVRISYDRVRLSGIFFRAYEAEQIFGEADLSAEIDKRVNDARVSGSTMKESVYRYQVGSRLIADYNRWKTTFQPG